MSLYISKILYLDELQNDFNKIGNYYDNFHIPQNLGSQEGLNQVPSDGTKMKKTDALFVPINNNPNQSRSRGLWSKMFTVFSPLGPEFNKTLFTNKALKIQGKIFMYTAIRP